MINLLAFLQQNSLLKLILKLINYTKAKPIVFISIFILLLIPDRFEIILFQMT